MFESITIEKNKMKKINVFAMLLAVVALSFGVTGCKPKDADIKAAVEKALTEKGMEGMTADVKEGVVTLTGECKDDACKTSCTDIANGVKGVKEVVSNCTVKPAPMPVEKAEDATLVKALADAIKSYATVKGEVKDGGFVLSGTIAQKDWSQLQQVLMKLGSKKGIDKSGLTIK